MPSTERVASLGTEHDGLVLAVGAVVLVGVLFMGASVLQANAMASSVPPHVKVTTTTPTRAQDQAPASNDVTSGQTASVSAGGAAGGASGAGASVSQTIAVSVLPGPLTVTPSSDTVTFSRSGNDHGGSYGSALPLVRVVDARGSLAGWEAFVSLQGIDGLSASELAGAQLCANPDTPTIVAGNPGEVRAAGPSCGGVGDPVSVFFAASGGGGGTFTDTATLTLGIPGANATDPVSATLAVIVH